MFQQVKKLLKKSKKNQRAPIKIELKETADKLFYFWDFFISDNKYKNYIRKNGYVSWNYNQETKKLEPFPAGGFAKNYVLTFDDNDQHPEAFNT